LPACTGLSCELAFSPPASDDRGVVRVEFRVANVLKCTDSTSPYTCAWAVPEQANVSDVLTGERGARTTDRVLAIVLFTDIVGSTSQVATLGDERWGEMRAAHHEAVRRELERFRGREVDTAGDGFFATFDGPGRAIRCAQAIGAAVRRLGLEVRAGVHTGECEIRGAEVSGIAVHIGARVMALAGPSEVLVSQTVKDLA
jgi:class 3 adenylate cyclase